MLEVCSYGVTTISKSLGEGSALHQIQIAPNEWSPLSDPTIAMMSRHHLSASDHVSTGAIRQLSIVARTNHALIVEAPHSLHGHWALPGSPDLVQLFRDWNLPPGCPERSLVHLV